MKIIRHNSEILEAQISDKNFRIIWLSDLHFDSKFSEWEKVKKYLNENPDVYIVIGGDSVDVMQFTMDRRASKNAIKEEHNGDDYANRVIITVRKEIVDKYKDRIICWNRGNHDNSIIKHHNIDLLSLICGVDVHVHEYSGYIVLGQTWNKKRKSNLTIHFSHSPMGGGVVTKGALGIDRAKAQYPSADIWICEHIHDNLVHAVRHEFLNAEHMTINQKTKWYIQNMACKQESQGPRNGFHYETNKGNRASGILELSFIHDYKDHRLTCNKVNHIVF